MLGWMQATMAHYYDIFEQFPRVPFVQMHLNIFVSLDRPIGTWFYTKNLILEKPMQLFFEKNLSYNSNGLSKGLYMDWSFGWDIKEDKIL